MSTEFENTEQNFEQQEIVAPEEQTSFEADQVESAPAPQYYSPEKTPSETSTLSNASTPKAKHDSPEHARNKFNFESEETKTPIQKQPTYSSAISPKNGSRSPVSSTLSRSTAARVHDAEVMLAKKKVFEETNEIEQLKRSLSFKSEPKFSPVKPTSAKKGSGPSERLLKTTQNRILDIRELENKKDRIIPSNDIWWEIRKNAEMAHKRDDVASKLYEPTVAYLKSNRSKFPIKKIPTPGAPETPEKEHHVRTIKINSESPLLKPTKATQIATWGLDRAALEPLPSFAPHLCESGPQNVHSKFSAETYASTSHKWKSKEQIATEEAAEVISTRNKLDSGVPKVKEVSERLTTLNTNMKASYRRKSVKEEGDARENGWAHDFVKQTIPELDSPGFSSPTTATRRQSLSPDHIKGRDSNNGSVSGSGSAASGSRHSTPAKYANGHSGRDREVSAEEMAAAAIALSQAAVGNAAGVASPTDDDEEEA